MRDVPVVIFGAGATKDSGGPLTNEILPEAFQSDPTLLGQQHAINLLRQFLDEHFPQLPPPRGSQDYPGLSLLLSLLDTAIDRRQPLGDWSTERVADVRQAVEAAIFAVLDFRRPHHETTAYHDLLVRTYPGPHPEATVLSLNYDMILDAAMFDLSAARVPKGMPRYGCEIVTPAYQNNLARWGALYKLHGSVNWKYCARCHRLDIGWSSKRQAPSPIGHLFFGGLLDEQYEKRLQCDDCGTTLRPILITPTYRKDYRNPHIARVWYEAERALRTANRVIFVGYSLPEDDIDVVYLLKRGLGVAPALSPSQITVVEKVRPGDTRLTLREHPVGQRYRALFGEGIDFRTEGFTDWITAHQQHNWSPLTPGLPHPPHPAGGR
jgi:hypothetical protein